MVISATHFDFNANLLEYLFVDNAKEKYNDILELREKHNYKTAFDLMQIENILEKKYFIRFGFTWRSFDWI